jgi:oligoendopeptidase F
VTTVHPYVMLNYLGKPRDVMTLAHELGHGVHQVLAAGQGELLSSTPLTLAETASVFGEMLTFRTLLDGAKIIVEGTDNLPAKFLASDAARALGTPVIHGACAGWQATVLTAVAAGEVRDWERLVLTRGNTPAVPECEIFAVNGPFPFGIDPNP